MPMDMEFCDISHKLKSLLPSKHKTSCFNTIYYGSGSSTFGAWLQSYIVHRPIKLEYQALTTLNPNPWSTPYAYIHIDTKLLELIPPKLLAYARIYTLHLLSLLIF